MPAALGEGFEHLSTDGVRSQSLQQTRFTRKPKDTRQSEIAERLGVFRVTVVRLLSDARERGDIQFHIARAVPECIDLERELETAFGLAAAIVVPLSSAEADATLPISAAAGTCLTEHARKCSRSPKGREHGAFDLGIMVETPAALLQADELAAEVTFLERPGLLHRAGASVPG